MKGGSNSLWNVVVLASCCWMPSAKTKTEVLILGGTIITHNSLNKKRWYLYIFGCIFTLLFSRSVVSDSLRPRGLQHARLSCPSPSPRACSISCPLSQWCHPTISSSVAPFSSCLLSFPASGFFPMSQLFVSGGQSIGASASASVLPMNIQGWFLLGLTGLISLQSRDSQESSPTPQFELDVGFLRNVLWFFWR